MSFVYSGRRYTSEVEDAVEVQFECSVCSHRAKASVHARGEGVSVSPFGLRNEAAAASARDSSRDDLWRHACETVRAVRCPACGQRNSAARAELVLSGLLKNVGLLVLCALLGLFLDALEGRNDIC